MAGFAALIPEDSARIPGGKVTMEKTFATESVEETIALGERLAGLLEPGDVLVLVGDLGAGKTHLAKGIARGLGVTDEVTSPTFNILRLHDGSTAGGEPVQLAHWDLYRLEEPEQLDDVDFFGIVESGCISLVEWGDKFPNDMPDDYLLVDISIAGGGTRCLALTPHGPRAEQVVAAI